jgi:hypothetical protein
MPDAGQPSSASSPPNPLVAGLHFRGTLPHLKREGAVYFVTFRLADSLPAHEVARLKHERQVILEQARAAKRPLTWHEEQQLLAWYCDKVEALLDAGRGACWLSKPEIAGLVAGALNHFAGQRYELRAWVVMPNVCGRQSGEGGFLPPSGRLELEQCKRAPSAVASGIPA